MKLRCSLCRQTFYADRWPDECPVCFGMIASKPENEVAAPLILTAATKSNDKLLRDMQKGAETRAEIAAESLGVPVADMAAMKVNDFNLRKDAEVMAMPVRNAVTEQMDRQTAGFGFSNGSGYAQAAAAGVVTHNDQVVGRVEPRAGARTQANLQRLFNR